MKIHVQDNLYITGEGPYTVEGGSYHTSLSSAVTEVIKITIGESTALTFQNMLSGCRLSAG